MIGYYLRKKHAQEMHLHRRYLHYRPRFTLGLNPQMPTVAYKRDALGFWIAD